MHLKPGDKPSAPNTVFTVIINPILERASSDERIMRRMFGSATVSVTKRRRERWSEPEVFTCNCMTELNLEMMMRANKSGRNLVVSPNASDALTLSGFWLDVTSCGARWVPKGVKGAKITSKSFGGSEYWFRRLVVRGNPDIIDYCNNGLRFIWISGRQFFDMPEAELARSIDYPWNGQFAEPGVGVFQAPDPAKRCLLWSRAFTRLIDWWHANAKAPFGLTIGQLSVGILRTHIPPRSLCTHTDREVHRLERSGAFGGRASCWFVGDVGCQSVHERNTVLGPPPSPWPSIPGPLYQVDVRSMYPTLLRDMQYPVKLLSYRTNVGVNECKELAANFGVIASVLVHTNEAEYPLREGDRVIYPTGEFTTVLTGPELVRLSEHGRVLKCHQMAVYQLGRPFARAADSLLTLRSQATIAGRAGGELFAKRLANSLAGKLAQRRGRWIERRNAPAERDWGEWIEVDDATGVATRFRAVAGLVWEWEADPDGAGPFTAAFDYLTAYGRLRMQAIRRLLPQGAVIAQDTDGVWVTPGGLATLQATPGLFGHAPGDLRITSVTSNARFYSPKHYWTDDGWTLAGFHNPTVLASTQTILDTFERNPVSSGCLGPPLATFTLSRTSRLKPATDGGWVNAFGWVQPPFRPKC